MKHFPLVILLLSGTLVHAQSAGTGTSAVPAPPPATGQVPGDPGELLGMTPAQAFMRFGAPDRVFAVRGAEPWQDDVVFEYSGGFSLFLCLDRVWQVRLAEPYAAPVMGFSLGASVERAVSVFGVPELLEAASWEWNLPGSAWPVRLRGNGDAAGAIREVYIYRADF